MARPRLIAISWSGCARRVLRYGIPNFLFFDFPLLLMIFWGSFSFAWYSTSSLFSQSFNLVMLIRDRRYGALDNQDHHYNSDSQTRKSMENREATKMSSECASETTHREPCFWMWQLLVHAFLHADRMCSSMLVAYAFHPPKIWGCKNSWVYSSNPSDHKIHCCLHTGMCWLTLVAYPNQHPSKAPGSFIYPKE